MKKILSTILCYFPVKKRSYGFLPVFLFLMFPGFLNATEETAENKEKAQKASDVFVEVDLNKKDDDDYYFGVFVGAGKLKNTHVDVEGFANWGHPGSSVDYDDSATVGGFLIGKKASINGLPVRLELDGTFGKMSAQTNRLDPEGLDETAKSEVLWLVTARAGLEKNVGLVTLLANSGLALARISNSVTDIDFRRDAPPQRDPDDSFQDNSIHLGWVFGLGAEIPLDKNLQRALQDDETWTLRLEGSYINFGKDRYTVNHSGNNRCGVDGPRRPCIYTIKNEIGILRFVLSRRFSL
ncbi:MAG: hypothetical protein OXB86_06295 [Bdellovibrionales bacterium]|nr:hypothetical protein [Bdellovibrionales bacterium]